MDTTPGLPPLEPQPYAPPQAAGLAPAVVEAMPPQATTPRHIPISLVAGGVMLLAAVVGYTLGRVHTSPTTGPATPATQNPAYTPRPSSQPSETVPLNAGEVTVGTKTIVSGTITQLTPSGFTMRVVSRTINTGSGTLGEQTKLYTVKLVTATKLMLTTTTVTMPAGGGTPKITQATKTIKPGDLKPEQAVTVTSSTSGSTLTALEVRASVVVRQ